MISGLVGDCAHDIPGKDIYPPSLFPEQAVQGLTRLKVLIYLLIVQHTPLSALQNATSSVERFVEGISLGSTTADVSGNWRSCTLPVTAALTEDSAAITAISTGSADPIAVLQISAMALSSPGRTTQEYRNLKAFAAVKSDSSVIT